MDTASPENGPDNLMDEETQHSLQNLHLLSRHEIEVAYNTHIPCDHAPLAEFWASYDPEKKSIGRLACLLLWKASGCRYVPREFQLKATIATMSGQHSLIDVGTGYGKTLCMILPSLLSPNTISLVVSPLKRLQAVQVLEFELYGIRTVAINEDTPNDPLLWKVRLSDVVLEFYNVSLTQEIQEGKYSVLLVQPEQLFMFNGHMPRLARLVAQNRQFTQLIKRIHIDEAHFIYSAGLGHYGQPPFRSAWGRLGEFLIKLGKNVSVQALSGTQPIHIKKVITKHLLFDENLCSIKLSSNRPNTIYATHEIVGNLSNFQNLDFLIPDNCDDGLCFPKTLVFHDNSNEAATSAFYNDRRLPKNLWDKGIIRHYHGGMSKEYLTSVYDDFSKPDGVCCILHATEGASTGLDIPDIEVVIQYGISRDVPTTLQRGGRGGRDSSGEAIFLIMYEPWVKKIDCSVMNIDIDTLTDPDHPIVSKLSVHSTKQDRTGIGMIMIIQKEKECIRGLFANYLQDKLVDALRHTTQFCCDRHPSTNFHIRQFFKGRFLYQDPSSLDIYYGDVDENDCTQVLPPPKAKRKYLKSRAPGDRKELVGRLLSWRLEASSNDPLAAVRPPSFIVDNKGILTLAKLHPTEITHHEQVVFALKETQEWNNEWSTKIFNIIHNYDRELVQQCKVESVQVKERMKRAKVEQDLAKFWEESERTAARIRQETLQRFAGKSLGTTLQSASPNPHNIQLRRSDRLGRHKN